MKLNDRTVTLNAPALPGGKTDYTFFDDDIPGFGLRVRTSGSKAWIYQFWQDNRAHKMTLGKYPKINAKQGRELMGKFAKMVAEGRNPASEKIIRREAETFKEVAEQFLAAKENNAK